MASVYTCLMCIPSPHYTHRLPRVWISARSDHSRVAKKINSVFFGLLPALLFSQKSLSLNPAYPVHLVKYFPGHPCQIRIIVLKYLCCGETLSSSPHFLSYRRTLKTDRSEEFRHTNGLGRGTAVPCPAAPLHLCPFTKDRLAPAIDLFLTRSSKTIPFPPTPQS